MFSLEPQDHVALDELNSTYGFRYRGTEIICDIHCLLTKKVYASATGSSELEAVQNAIEVAKTATKPYATKEAAANATLQTENEELKRQLAEMKGEPEPEPEGAST